MIVIFLKRCELLELKKTNDKNYYFLREILIAVNITS